MIDFTQVSERGLWLLGEWSLRWGVLIGLLAIWFCIRAPRRSDVRYAIAWSVLLAGLCLPLVPDWGPGIWRSAEESSSSTRNGPAADVSIAPVAGVTPDPVATTSPLTFPPGYTRTPVEADEAPLDAVATAEPIRIRETEEAAVAAPVTSAVVPELETVPEAPGPTWSLPQLLMVAWGIGVAVMLSRLLLGLLYLNRLRRNSMDASASLAQLFIDCRRELGVRRAMLSVHPQVASPIVCGLLRPCVIVPPDFGELERQTQRACLAHELTHVRRGDSWAVLLAETVRAVFFFHPLLHWLVARLNLEREYICDEAALRVESDQRRYAADLLSFGRRGARLQFTGGMPFGRRSTVKARVARVLAARELVVPSSPRRRLMMTLCLVGACATLGALRFEALAGTNVDPPEATQGANRPDTSVAEPGLASRRNQSAKSALDLYGDPLPEGAIARLGTVRYRMLRRIHFLADGRTVIGNRGSKLEWMDVSSGRIVREMELVALRALSPDRSLAAVSTRRVTADDDEQSITIIDAQTGDVRSQVEWKQLAGESQGFASFLPDNHTLLTCSPDVLRVWDLDSRDLRESLELPIEAPNKACALSPDGAWLALNAGDAAHLWNWQTGEHFQLPGPLDDGIDDAAFTPDGTNLATVSDELNGVRVWDVATRRLLWRGNSGVRSQFRQRIALSSDGQLLATAVRRPASVQLWDVATGNLIATLDTGELEPSDIAISPDDRWLAVHGAFGTTGPAFQVWDLETRQRIGGEFFGHQQLPTEIRFTPDGEQVVTGSPDGIVGVWDAESGALDQRIGHAPGACVTALAVSPNGELIASGSHDNTVVVWDRKSGERLFTLVGHGRFSGTGALQFSPDSRRLLSFGDDWFLRAFDVTTGKAVLEHAIRLEDVPLKEGEDGGIPLDGMDVDLDLHPNEVFTPDGSRLVLGVRNALHVVDVETGRETEIIAARGDDQIGVSPDGRWVASVRRAPSVEVVLPDGRGQYLSTNEQAIVIHSLESGEILHQFRLPNGFAQDFAFSPDGRMLAVEQVSIHVYEIDSGRELARIEPELPTISSGAVAFSPDGARLAASHGDASVLVWDWRRFAIDSSGEAD